SVFIKPIVGVLSSGSEIKDLGEALENPAQIRSSNHIAIANLAKNLNCDTRVFPLLKDDEKATFSTLESALQSCDILVTTGGVSMGDFDFLKKAIKEYEIIIDKADIKPG
ncbi:molybdopterin molybdenumtransferase MoeA, partial [Campylobacter coli]|nr:molybdopterin molybdenumtransferase MoeA [Campylobacter coli]